MLVVNPRKQKLCIQVKDSLGFTDLTIGVGEVSYFFLLKKFWDGCITYLIDIFDNYQVFN